MKRNIALLLCAVFCSSAIFAQGRIDKVIDSMEGKPDVETTYTERRSPKKKKLIATSRIFNFENTYYFEKLCKAFEEERNNSVSAVKTKNQMTYRFDDNKSVCTYTLSWSSDRGPFTMVMTWRSSEAKDSSYIIMDGELNELNFNSGAFSMSVDELLKELNLDSLLNGCGSQWIMSRDGQVIELSVGGRDNGDIVVRTIDDYGCPVSMTYGSDEYFRYVRSESKKARCEARKQAAKARQKAAKARREAAKARAEARREASKARAEAQRAAARARREAAKARRASLNTDHSEKIYELASRSRCRIISPAGELTEMNALDALDNDAVWSALEDAVDSGKRTITTTTISGSTTTVIIEPGPEKI